MNGKAYNLELTKHIQGRSILEKVIPTVCSLERMLEHLIVCNGDYSKLEAWEKSCYRAYRLETVLSKLLDAGISERIEIIKENLLSLKPQELGPNGIDIYLVAYVAEKYGSGKNVFGSFIMQSGISDKQNSVNAIWQVGKRDGIYLGLLNDDGTIKNWSFFEDWLAGATSGGTKRLDKINTSGYSTINIERRCTFNNSYVRKIADYVSKGYCRDDYLKEKNVIGYLDWLDGKLDPVGVFNHSYYLAKAKQNWQCSSLYEAYENYWWGYNNYCILNGNRMQGNNFSQSFQYMEYMAGELRNAVKNGNFELAAKASLSMLSWGGVLAGNQKRIEALGSQLCNYYNYVQESLNLQSVCLGFQNDIQINSGFTKLYFLLVDDFIMYDGRVGAAMGLLGRLYAEEKGLPAIPKNIEFSFGSGKVTKPNYNKANRRNPSTKKYMLPEFSGNQKRHLDDNIKASWLLKSLADKTTSRFSHLPQEPPLNMRLTAIQSALFMVGYDVINAGNKRNSDC